MKSLQTICLLFASAGLVAAQQYTINTIAGVPQVPGLYPAPGDTTVTPATSGQMYNPSVVFVDKNSNVYIGDAYTYSIRMVSSGNISTIGGNGAPGYSGEDVGATTASITDVRGIAEDSSGNIYFSDTSSCRIRRIDNPFTNVTPNIFTFSGNTAAPYCGPTSGSPFTAPGALAFDSKGNLYVADYGASAVRVINSSGVVTTFAGAPGTYGNSGDGGPASKATLAYPVSLAFDAAGNLYIGDEGNSNIRKVDTNGNITTVVTGVDPEGLGIDSSGAFYYVDGVSSTVRKILPGGGVVTIAGNGAAGYGGDGGQASQAQVDQPEGLALGPDGTIYIADTLNDIVRHMVPIPNSVGVQDSASEVSGSNLQPGYVSPGEVLTLFGSGLGPAALTEFTLGANGNFPMNLAGTAVNINGSPAPIIYTSSNLVAVVAPFEITGSPNASIAVTYQGSTHYASQPVAAATPAIFTANETGTGQAAAINAVDGTVNSPSNPAHLGDYIALYVTGAGYTTNPVDGQPTPANCGVSCLPMTVGQVAVKVGNQFVTPSYAGGAPSLVAGVTQINFQIPPTLIPGNALVTVVVNGYPSQAGVTVAIAP